MKIFIEIETSTGYLMLVNLDNVDTISESKENKAIISFSTSSDDYVVTKETYRQVKDKLAISVKMLAINSADYKPR